jgi:L,D-peptidoglycan transpeptidase YkuD (ErfK/YbiS/YcfS/YnhG family)
MQSVNSIPARKCRVQFLSGAATQGVLKLPGGMLRCAIGRSGCRAIKREGDGASPLGSWPVRSVYYRADRITRPRTRAPLRPLRPDDGWCDAPGDRNYNRPVRHPYPASAEQMWRADHLYDIVVVLGHNDVPRRRGMGSAIFMHLARAGYRPTEGCIALKLADMRRLLAALDRGTRVEIGTVSARPCWKTG